MIKTRLKGMLIAILVGGVIIGGLTSLIFGAWQQEIMTIFAMASIMFYLAFNRSHLIEGKDGIWRSSEDDNFFCGIIAFFSFLVLAWSFEKIANERLIFASYFVGGAIAGICFFLIRKFSGYQSSDL